MEVHQVYIADLELIHTNGVFRVMNIIINRFLIIVVIAFSSLAIANNNINNVSEFESGNVAYLDFPMRNQTHMKVVIDEGRENISASLHTNDGWTCFPDDGGKCFASIWAIGENPVNFEIEQIGIGGEFVIKNPDLFVKKFKSNKNIIIETTFNKSGSHQFIFRRN